MKIEAKRKIRGPTSVVSIKNLFELKMESGNEDL